MRWLVVVALVVLTGCEATTPPSLAPTVPAPKDLPSIQAEIERTYPGQFATISADARTVSVNFWATNLAAARVVEARYGDSVDITVGVLPYPAPPDQQSLCGFLGQRVVDPGPFHATIEMAPRIGHGQFRGEIAITNTGATAAELDSDQPVLIYLYLRAGGGPVSAFEGAIGGTGFDPTISAGVKVIAIEAIGRTTSCDIARGYDLPDGDYIARGLVKKGHTGQVFLTDPLPITIASIP